jgi:hypothetical protein
MVSLQLKGAQVRYFLWGTRTRQLVTSGVALVLILALAFAAVRFDLIERIRQGDAISSHNTAATGNPRAAETTVQPGAPATLKVGNVRLDIPAEAVAAPTVAHLALGGQSLVTQLPTRTAKLLQPKGEVIRVDLSGIQPLKALTLTVPGYPGKYPVMLTKHNRAVTSLPLRRTPAGLVAKLTQLSEFMTAIVNAAKAIRSFAETIKPFISMVTGAQGQKPKCAGEEFKLPDDSMVKVSDLTQEDILWPCIDLLDNGHIKVTVHNVSPAPWRIRSSGGTYDGAAEAELPNAAKQSLVSRLTTQVEHNDGYVLSQGTGRWTFDLGELPADMAGRVSLGMYLAEITVFAAIMIASLPAGGGNGYMLTRTIGSGIAQLAEHDASEALSCIVKAGQTIADGIVPDAKTLANLVKTALACAETVSKYVFKKSLGFIGSILIAVLSTGVALVAGAILGMTHTILDVDGLVTWRVTQILSRQALINLVAGTWARHSTGLTINSDGSGNLIWRTYTVCGTEEAGHACDSGPPPHMEGGGKVTFKLVVIGGKLQVQVLTSNDSYFPKGGLLPIRFDQNGQILVFGSEENPRNVGYFRLCDSREGAVRDPAVTAECGA